MRAGIVIISEIAAENFTQMSLVDHDHVVDAVPTNRTVHPFNVGILPRGAVGGDDLFDSQGLNTSSELGAVNAVSISNYIARGRVERERLDHLLRCPCSRWKPRHIEVGDLPPFMPQDDKYVEQAKSEGRHDEEVDGGDLTGMVLQKGLPRL